MYFFVFIKQIAESVVTRKKAKISESRRVSFAETYEVK